MNITESKIDLSLWGTRVAWILIPAIIVLTPMYWFFSYGAVQGPGPAQGDSVHVTIPSGGGFSSIYKALVDGEVLYDDCRFGMLASWSGISKRLKAGEYTFQRPVSPKQILIQLEKGSSILHSVTLREGLSIYEIAGELRRQGWDDTDDIVKLCMDQEFVTALGIPASSLEGYLFPDTYFLAKYQSSRSILKMMVARFFQVWVELETQYRDVETPAWAMELSRHELVTLASIVEKETGLASERPQIARVFYNRLQKRMRLQADPTVIYGLGNFDGNLTKRDLRTPSSYNTYLLSGLPAGPIANPGKEALRAVIAPSAGSWLYFVARGGDGSHQFSRTLKEHNRAVYKYQKKRR